MKPWLRFFDRLFSWAALLVLGGLILTRFVLPRASDPVDPRWSIPARRPVLGEFMSARCPACILMQPVVGGLEKRYRGRVEVRRCDLEREGPLAARFGVRVTPTFLVADASGRVRARFQGATSFLALSRAVEGILNERSKP